MLIGIKAIQWHIVQGRRVNGASRGTAPAGESHNGNPGCLRATHLIGRIRPALNKDGTVKVRRAKKALATIPFSFTHDNVAMFTGSPIHVIALFHPSQEFFQVGRGDNGDAHPIPIAQTIFGDALLTAIVEPHVGRKIRMLVKEGGIQMESQCQRNLSVTLGSWTVIVGTTPNEDVDFLFRPFACFVHLHTIHCGQIIFSREFIKKKYRLHKRGKKRGPHFSLYSMASFEEVEHSSLIDSAAPNEKLFSLNMSLLANSPSWPQIRSASDALHEKLDELRECVEDGSLKRVQSRKRFLLSHLDKLDASLDEYDKRVARSDEERVAERVNANAALDFYKKEYQMQESASAIMSCQLDRIAQLEQQVQEQRQHIEALEDKLERKRHKLNMTRDDLYDLRVDDAERKL